MTRRSRRREIGMSPGRAAVVHGGRALRPGLGPWHPETTNAPAEAGAFAVMRVGQLFDWPYEPSCFVASTTRTAMADSATLPQARGSYCFLFPTSPSSLSTPS